LSVSENGIHGEKATFGAAVRSLFNQANSVFTSNPFATNMTQAKLALSVGVVFLFITLFGSLYFRDWDRKDAISAKYLNKTEEKKYRESLVKSGGGFDDFDDLFGRPRDPRGFRGNVTAWSLERFYSDLKPKGTADVSHSATSSARSSTALSGMERGRRNSVTCTAMEAEHFASIHDFFSTVLGGRIFDTRRETRMLEDFLKDHRYSGVFADPSQSSPRLRRFLDLVRRLLVTLFTGTMFFYVYYPSDNTCNSHHNRDSCLSEPSRLQTDGSLCKWYVHEGQQECELNLPPTSTIFVITLTDVYANCESDECFDRLFARQVCLPEPPFSWYS
jgi:hypothetical protein